MFVPWIDAVSGLFFGRMDRWTIWLIVLPALVGTAVYFGIVTLFEGAIYGVLYCVNIAVRRWGAFQPESAKVPDEAAIFE
jgi:hypothetical protein